MELLEHDHDANREITEREAAQDERQSSEAVRSRSVARKTANLLVGLRGVLLFFLVTDVVFDGLMALTMISHGHNSVPWT